jgi:hypothetical protein
MEDKYMSTKSEETETNSHKDGTSLDGLQPDVEDNDDGSAVNEHGVLRF